MKRCLAVLALCATAASAQDEAERASRAYDVRFLTRSVEHFKGPGLELGWSQGDSIGIGVFEAEGNSPVTGEFLASAIVTNFDEDSWSDSRNSIEYSSGVLYVTQTKENHEKISKYVEMLRRRFSRRIVVESDVLLIAPAAFAATGALPGILTAEQEKALRDAAADPARGRSLTLLRAVAMNGQRVFAADMKQTSYVRDYDVEIAQDAVIADPVSGDLRHGTVLDVKPVLTHDAATVMMETRFSMARPRSMTTFDTGVPALGTIQMPSRDILRTKTTLSCPMGRTALLCSGVLSGEKDWIAVVLVRPTLSGQTAGDETASTEKRQLRMFDVSSLTAGLRDFPGPALDLLWGDRDAGAPTTTFVPPSDEGSGLSPEALIAAIQNNVAHSSWTNSRNRLWQMGDQIVAVQSPAVLEDIAKFLAVAAPARNRLIGVEMAIVSMDEATWSARRASLSGGSPAEDGLKDLLQAATNGSGPLLVSSTGGVCMNDQRFHVWAGRDQAYLQDMDVEIAQGASCGDPVIGIQESGSCLDIRPTLAGDGKRLHVELRPGCAIAQEPVAFDTKAANVGRIQKVRMTIVDMRTQMFVTDGAWALAAITTGSAGGKATYYATLVRVRTMEAK